MNNTLTGKLTSRGNLNGNVNTIVYAHNYNDLTNKPSINNITLQGNKTASELGLATPYDITVTSVNEQTGDVILSGSDIDYSEGLSLNAKIDDLEAQITVSGVQTVNGMTGNVTLTSNDIDYSTGVTIKNKIDSVEGEIPDEYVSSVNGNSGAVTLTGSDIIYSGVQSVNGAIDSLSEDLSDLTAEDIPMSGTDSTSVATAVGDLSRLSTTVKSSIVGAVNEIASYTPVYGNTASGAIATFNTSLALPLQDCTIDINAVQESGTPTPSSPKAISGFTGANIHVADDENPHVIDNVTPITWQDEAGTVYGGSLDVTSGKLVSKYARIKISDMNWNKGSGFFFSSLPLKKNGVTNILCECLRVVDVSSVSEMVNGDIKGHPGNTNMYIKNTDWASATDLYNAIGDYYIVYELATPITYQLTPTQISAIVGTNNIFTDTNGDTSVVYACSLKDYIDSQ